ncbi:hypothetical protein F965_00494 [Acinetobacter schindleri NIPH 900]|uniref:Uncharacterized protein n=1 Tax=Acinetobacter schindleri NIPH 900 TaxID=1217675 RepID=N8WQJ8_9GAMM|nr:hypothetical protein [Acinetobacter schindleri]ENV14251.1 hypothetical protein F965_00494 [Acinetobacter schindleri NIPH 900]
MNTSKILGEAVGIQWQGTKDKTQANLYSGLTQAIFIGRFKRGRTDKPMTITNSNIKAKLGYEPTNPDYIAIQDCLDAGVPSVLVLHVGSAVVEQGEA